MVDHSHFASVGENVMIDPTVRILGASSIAIGSNTRIDAFALISAGEARVSIGSHVHIAAGAYIFGSSAEVIIEDFVGISSGVRIYTASDDYRDGWLTGPTVPHDLKKLAVGPITLGKHVIVGAGAVILPGVSIGFGGSVGALSVVRGSVGEGKIMAGNPIREIGKRDVGRLRALEMELRGREREEGGLR